MDLVVFILVKMLPLQPGVLLGDGEAPVLALAYLDLVRSGPALAGSHQQALQLESYKLQNGPPPLSSLHTLVRRLP